MSPEARAIALVAPHCDIEERLLLVPPSACVRGIYFRSIEKQLATRDKLTAYKEYFPEDRFGALTFYPVSAYIPRLACAGAILASPARVHEGMMLIGRANAMAFMDSLLGRLMLRVLSGDPVRLMEQSMAGRRQSTNYGQWELRHSGRSVEIIHRQEYIWIESAMAGAGLGTFEACGVDVKLEVRMVDRLNGSTHWAW